MDICEGKMCEEIVINSGANLKSSAVVRCSVLSNSLRLHARLLCPWGFSRQACWSGLPCRLTEDLPKPGIDPGSLVLQADSFLADHEGSPQEEYWLPEPRGGCTVEREPSGKEQYI